MLSYRPTIVFVQTCQNVSLYFDVCPSAPGEARRRTQGEARGGGAAQEEGGEEEAAAGGAETEGGGGALQTQAGEKEQL